LGFRFARHKFSLGACYALNTKFLTGPQRQPPPVGSAFSPKLHIDVQIHISPESSAEQIDKIFESMAKHLKDFRS
ncbi:hypothetical protein K6Y74_37430, partial [Burkholderia cenocepacia]|nr:hypothetical protein [Burkholderia cenocepacia]MCW3634059.1 hypothetical protein [Burkholderia cenocepacia]MCW3648944.1 hypothetical protein [Burkholderia cenocepacia]